MPEIDFTLEEGWAPDYGYKTGRIHPETMIEHGIEPNDILHLQKDDTELVVRTWRKHVDEEPGGIKIDPYLYETTDLEPGDTVQIYNKKSVEYLTQVTLKPVEKESYGVLGDPYQTGHAILDNHPIIESETTPVLHLKTENGCQGFAPVQTEPVKTGIVKPWTLLEYQANPRPEGDWQRENPERKKIDFAVNPDRLVQE